VVSLAIMVAAWCRMTLVRCSQTLSQEGAARGRSGAALDRMFEAFILDARAIRSDATTIWAIDAGGSAGVAFSTLVLTLVIASFSRKGFFPTEDIGQISVTVEAVEDISFRR